MRRGPTDPMEGEYTLVRPDALGVRRRRPRLAVFVAATVTGLVTLTAAALLFTASNSIQRTTEAAASALVEAELDRVSERVRSFMISAERELDVAARLLPTAEFVPAGGPAADAAFERHFLAVLDTRQELTMLGAADALGNFIMVRRMGDGSLDTKRVLVGPGDTRRVTWTDRPPGIALLHAGTQSDTPDDPYDPRTRPWYQGTLAARGPFLSGVYDFHTGGVPGVTLAAPFGAAGRVLCADIEVRALAAFVGSMNVGRSGQAFLIDQQARLIAAPPSSLPAKALSPIESSPSEMLVAAAPTVKSVLAGRPTGSATFEYRLNDALHRGVLTQVAPHRAAQEAPWFVGVIVPDSEFAAPLEEGTRRSAVASVILVALSILVAILLSRRIARGLETLARETTRIAGLHFEDEPRRDPGFRELEDVMSAFENMKLGLRAFQKYLPMNLVRKLLRERVEPRLSSEHLEITVLFSDIESFTTLTEATHPLLMSQRLGAYLGELTALIEQHGGTVLQYVGDEIMAIFNAPEAVPQHARRAMEAALACARRTDPLLGTPGRPALFRTRFGVHTAKVAVGHFGSPDRLYFGAIGDGINVASRLEGANKLYGTTILASEAVAQAQAEGLVFRRVDRVVLKGRQAPLEIYEPLGEGEAPAWARRYEAALNDYWARRFSEAAQGFREVLAERHDGPSVVMLARAEAFALAPPPADWDGAYIMTLK